MPQARDLHKCDWPNVARGPAEIDATQSIRLNTEGHVAECGQPGVHMIREMKPEPDVEHCSESKRADPPPRRGGGSAPGSAAARAGAGRKAAPTRGPCRWAGSRSPSPSWRLTGREGTRAGQGSTGRVPEETGACGEWFRRRRTGVPADTGKRRPGESAGMRKSSRHRDGGNVDGFFLLLIRRQDLRPRRTARHPRDRTEIPFPEGRGGIRKAGFRPRPVALPSGEHENSRHDRRPRPPARSRHGNPGFREGVNSSRGRARPPASAIRGAARGARRHRPDIPCRRAR